jgi:hypothetical protein
MVNKKMLSAVSIILFVLSVAVIPQLVYCQINATDSVTPTDGVQQATGPDFLLIGAIVAVIAVVIVVVVLFFVKRKTVNEKSLQKATSPAFTEWVIKKFNGKPSDPSTGVSGLTGGGQPLLILQSDHVGLADVEAFVDVLIKGKAMKGAIVAFNFDADTLDGKVKAMDNEIDLQMLRVSEMLNKRYANKIKALAQVQVTFTPSQNFTPKPIHPQTYSDESQVIKANIFENMPREPQRAGLKPRVFISNSDTKVAGQVKEMLEFLHYDYVVGDKEEVSVPISEAKFGLMKECDAAIINICAVEQERRYSGLYILNSNVVSEINAAYLKYNTQVVLLVEKKVDLPPNLKGIKRIEYDSDDLSFTTAMNLEKILAGFHKI